MKVDTKKPFWCNREDGAKLALVQLPDNHSEAYWVCNEIQRLHTEEKIPYRASAVFYRTNAQSRSFEEELIKQGIPYAMVGGTAFYERKEIKDLLAYATLLVNPADLISFQRVVNEPKRKLGPRSVQKLYSYALSTQQPILTAAYQVYQAGRASGLSNAASREFGLFARLFDHWRERADELSLPQLLDLIFHESGYFEMLDADKDPQTQSRIENVLELINASGDYEEDFRLERDEPPTTLDILQGFLENITLISEQDQLEDAEDKVILMTIHGAKGLEFPYVFLTGMEDGLFPHMNSLNSKEGLEEERRLCYVGITRGMNRVYLTLAESRRLYNRIERTIPSRFLDEIPSSCIEDVSWGHVLSDRYLTDYIYDGEHQDHEYFVPSRQVSRESDFQPGDMVNHRSFGFGVVLDVEGEGQQARISVDFQNFGKKILIQEYARMEKV
jgi:DNA helicase-2/ATP-dependent DNA helicase PcrA